MGMALIECWGGIRRSQWSPWILALVTTLGESLLVGHWGAGESYFLDALAVASVLAGATLARVLGNRELFPKRAAEKRQTVDPPLQRSPRRTSPPASPSLVLAGLLLAQAVLMSHGAISRYVPFLPDRGLQAWILGREPGPNDAAAAAEIIDLLADTQGPVLSEEPSFVLAAGRALVGNANQLRDLDEKGLWHSNALVADVQARRFGVIVLNAQRYPASVLSAIGRSYYLARTVPFGAATYLVFYPGGERPGVSTGSLSLVEDAEGANGQLGMVVP